MIRPALDSHVQTRQEARRRLIPPGKPDCPTAEGLLFQRARLARVIPAFLVAWSVSFATQSALRAEETPSAISNASSFELVIVGLDRPVRIRLNVTVGGKGWKRSFDDIQHLEAIFAQLDGDQDGALSPAEARGAPPPRSWATLSGNDDVHVAFNFRVLDANGDGLASAKEFEEYARAFGEIPVRMLTVAAGRSNDDLFRVLDANRDRILTAAEWSAVAALKEKDRDGNRVLTAEELRGPMPVAMPPEFVAAVAGAKTVRKPLKLELKPATEGEPDAEFLVNYAETEGRPQRPQVRLKIAAAGAALGLTAEKGNPNEPALVLAGRRLVLRVPPPPVRSGSALRQQLLNEFESVADGSDKNVAASAAMPPLLKSLFRIADRNDDGRLELAELNRYVDRLLLLQVAADAARLRLVQFAERAGLMPLVDLNLDGRLSRRELQALPQTLTTLGGDAGRLTRDDLPSTVVLVLQHGPFSEATGQNPLENAGPPWFFRADRNQDGDLDREEFLGMPEDFRRLDTNEDGWIDLDEAILGDPGVLPTETEGKK